MSESVHNEQTKRTVGRELALGLRDLATIARLARVSEQTIRRWASEDEFVKRIREQYEFEIMEMASRQQLRLLQDGEIFLQRMMDLAQTTMTGRETKHSYDALEWCCNRVFPEQHTKAIEQTVQVSIDMSTQKQINTLLTNVAAKISPAGQHSLTNDPHLIEARDVSYGISPADPDR
jgi:hypothetical protein